jgi:hypothetical protein
MLRNLCSENSGRLNKTTNSCRVSCIFRSTQLHRTVQYKFFRPQVSDWHEPSSGLLSSETFSEHLLLQEVSDLILYKRHHKILTDETTRNKFSFHDVTAPSGLGTTHYRGFTTTFRHTTIGMTPLDEWSARRRDLYLKTHNTHHRQISMSRRGSKPLAQQASGRRTTL